MYTLFVILIIIASIILTLAVLAQSPKSGMAANFGVSNQVMGVRQTTDFLEKTTWIVAVAIVVLSVLSTVVMSTYQKKSTIPQTDSVIEQVIGGGEEAPVIPNQIDTTVPAEQSAE